MKKILLLFLFFAGLNFCSEKLFCEQEEAGVASYSTSGAATYSQFIEKHYDFVNLYFDVINQIESSNCSYEEGRKNIDIFIESMKESLGQESFEKLLNIVFVKTTCGYYLYPYKREVRKTALDVFCERLGGGWNFEQGKYYNYAISKLIECGAKKYKQLNTGIPAERVIYDYIQ